MGTAFPLLKVFENALWTALRTIFRQKSALQDFVYTVSTFSGGGGLPPELRGRRSATGA